MATPSSVTKNYDAVLSLSLENVRRALMDNIFKSHSFLAAMYGAYGKKKKSGKGLRTIDGGQSILVPILYGTNSTAKSYSGYEILDTTPQDGITTAKYDWRQIAVSISISRKEERQNAGQHKIRDLLQAKIDQAEMSLMEVLNEQLIGNNVSSGGVWSAGNDSKNVDPLFAFLPKDPSGSTAIGNINQSTYSWWRPVAIDGSAAHASKDSAAERGFNCATFATLIPAMRYTYNACGRGAGGFPDLILCDQLGFESYEASLDNRSRIVNDDSGPVSAGFESVRFKGADMIWDEAVPDVDTGVNYDDSSWARSTMAFLNTSFLEIVLDSGSDFITTPFVRPENQDAKTAQILAMMNLTCSNRRKQGLLYGITAGITS